MVKRKWDLQRFKRLFSAPFVGVLMSLVLVLGHYVEAADFTDDELKAVYLFRFAYLVNWENLPSQDNLYHYCVDGSSQVARQLETIAEQKRQKAKYWDITDDSATPSRCHILFTTSREEEHILSLRIQYPDSLLVGEGKRFVENGGMASFIKMNNRVRPYIDMHNLLGLPFTLRSQLLAIAVTKGEVQE
ncbi:YfiR family protein [Enterovibrio coralii]|uniref:YfiR family protein n=1 Tax=Enterovibrio coralii TaxID=294935 RepID=A0A135IBT9_9GAMM|nr:YfiR family protein [Enterovibrio coralii]KXF82926.1 hypothetical protein ATN88_03960 [Enterovibrio coralii]